MIRLDKFLVNLGYGTRTEIKESARRGLIFINGKKAVKTDIKVNEHTDIVEYDDEIVVYRPHIYLMLNKKAGYVTANSDPDSPTIFDLIPDEYKRPDMSAVGRLDKDTEGLLLVTTDGDMNHRLMSPKRHVDKVYYVETDGKILEEHIKIFENGIEFRDGTKLKPAKLEILTENTAKVTISEGKYHQVKNMFRVIDMNVTYLKRVKIANLSLDISLGLGECRELEFEEEMYLKEITGIIKRTVR